MSEITNIELMEWLAKGNGIAKNENSSLCLDTIGTCSEDKFNEPIREQIGAMPNGIFLQGNI